MKVYEILSLNHEFLKMLHKFGISSEDSAWLTGYLMRKMVRLFGEPCTR